MTEYVTFEQFTEVLAHNADNCHDSDIWVLHEDGSTEIIPDQPLHELQHPGTWPKYICRAAAVNDHVTYDTKQAADPSNPMAAVDGLYAALDHLNWAIGLTISASVPAQLRAYAQVLKTAIKQKRRGPTR